MRYLVLVLFVTACATSGKYKKAMNSWHGEPKESLVEKFGQPESTKQISENQMVYSYMLDDCKTDFMIVSGKITGWRGDGCKLSKSAMSEFMSDGSTWSTKQTAERDEQNAKERSVRRATAFKAMGEAQAHPTSWGSEYKKNNVHCTSKEVFGTIHTDCN